MKAKGWKGGKYNHFLILIGNNSVYNSLMLNDRNSIIHLTIEIIFLALMPLGYNFCTASKLNINLFIGSVLQEVFFLQ